jgi:hypothetical protein
MQVVPYGYCYEDSGEEEEEGVMEEEASSIRVPDYGDDYDDDDSCMGHMRLREEKYGRVLW